MRMSRVLVVFDFDDKPATMIGRVLPESKALEALKVEVHEGRQALKLPLRRICLEVQKNDRPFFCRFVSID